MNRQDAEPPCDELPAAAPGRTTPDGAGAAARRHALRALCVGALLGLLWYLYAYVAQVAFITEGSMIPTVYPGDRVLVSLSAYNHRPPRRGDLVVTDADPGQERLLKRVIGIEGDVVTVAYGVVLLNGDLLQEPYVGQAMLLEDPLRVEVGAGEVFLMGDNRNVSEDSRDHGPVPVSHIMGRVRYRLLPLVRAGRVH